MSSRTYDPQERLWDPRLVHAADVWSDGTTMLFAPGLASACFYFPGDPRFRSPVYSYDLTARAVDLTKRFEPLLTADGRCSAGNDIASDGTTVWVSSYYENKLAAFDVGTGARDPSRDLDNLLTTFPHALWTDGVTLWATGAGDDDVADDLYAYDLATRTRQPAKDFVDLRYYSKREGRDVPLVPVSLWSDGVTMWMSSGVAAGIFAYDVATRTPDPSRTISGRELDPAAMPRAARGMASDGITLWVGGGELFAFDLATRSRDHLKDVALDRYLATIDIWTDGATMWALEHESSGRRLRLHPFEMATGRSLGPWPDFELGRDESYTGMWSDGTTMWLSHVSSDRRSTAELHAFNLAARSRDPGRDIVLRQGEISQRIIGSMWSDGITIWVEEEHSAGPSYLAVSVRAYNLETGARDPRKDVLHPEREGLGGVRSFGGNTGIWSDGATMWVPRLIEESRTLDLIAFDVAGAVGNRPPEVVGMLAPLSLRAEEAKVEVVGAFRDPDGDPLSYRATSSASSVASVSVLGSAVVVTPWTDGTATVTVTATDPGGLIAAQSFAVRVTGRFTDDPIRPGVTPIRAVHFTELRERINGLRRGLGLSAFSWTDPVLQAGTTRVLLVHLLELRQALGAAYAAAGRTAPRWTDAAAVERSFPIRAAHLSELRAAVAALE